MADDEKNYSGGLASALQSISKNPMAIVFLIGLFAGGGGGQLKDVFIPPRADPYTGTMGAAEQAARISGDAALARALEDERKEGNRARYELSEKLRLLEAKLERLTTNVVAHNREAERYIEKIDQLEKKMEWRAK